MSRSKQPKTNPKLTLERETLRALLQPLAPDDLARAAGGALQGLTRRTTNSLSS